MAKAEAKDESFYHATRPIPSLPGYRIDRVGNLYSCLKKGGNEDHPRLTLTPLWRQLKQQVSKFGYLHTTVVTPNSRKADKRISRLVLEAWVGPCPANHEACHNDGNRTNNDLDNLRWDTMSGNQKDRVKHGTSSRGIHRSGRRKLSAADVIKIRELRAAGVRRIDVAAQFKIGKNHVTHLTKKRSWSYLNNDGTVTA